MDHKGEIRHDNISQVFDRATDSGTSFCRQQGTHLVKGLDGKRGVNCLLKILANTLDNKISKRDGAQSGALITLTSQASYTSKIAPSRNTRNTQTWFLRLLPR